MSLKSCNKKRQLQSSIGDKKKGPQAPKIGGQKEFEPKIGGKRILNLKEEIKKGPKLQLKGEVKKNYRHLKRKVQNKDLLQCYCILIDTSKGREYIIIE